jgi:hypothetical protein
MHSGTVRDDANEARSRKASERNIWTVSVTIRGQLMCGSVSGSIEKVKCGQTMEATSVDTLRSIVVAARLELVAAVFAALPVAE